MNSTRSIFVIGLLIFASVNLLNVRDAPASQAAAMAILLYLLLAVKTPPPLYFVPPIFVLDGVWAIAAGVLIIGTSIISDPKSWAGKGMLILIPSVIILTQVFTVGGDTRYNAARYIAILAPISFVFYLANRPVGTNDFDKYDAATLFVAATIVSIMSKSLYFPGERLSVFNGTENIAFVLMSILFILAQQKLVSIYSVAAALFAYAIYIYTLTSRTSAVLAIVVAGYAVYHRVHKGVLALLAIAALCFAYVYLSKSDDMAIAYVQLRFLLENIGSGDLLGVLSAIDIRGILYAEAVDLVASSPIFGHGAVQPSLFSITLYGLQEFHNGILDMLVTFGVAGLACYCLMIVSAISSVKSRGSIFWFILFVFFVSSMLQPIIFNLQLVIVLALALSASSRLGQASSGGSAAIRLRSASSHEGSEKVQRGGANGRA